MTTRQLMIVMGTQMMTALKHSRDLILVLDDLPDQRNTFLHLAMLWELNPLYSVLASNLQLTAFRIYVFWTIGLFPSV